MFYKVPRNQSVYVNLDDNNGKTHESQKIMIYVDTYFRECDLIEEFENHKGEIVCVFLIEKNVNDEQLEDYDDESEYHDSVINEVIYVLKGNLVMETDLSTQTPVSFGTDLVTV